MKDNKTAGSLIARNARATHDYYIEQRLEAGLALCGWEVKGLRNHRAHIKESYALIKDNEAWLIGSHITPPPGCSSSREVDPTRTRKLLLTRREIAKLTGLLERKGYALVPIKLYWKRHIAKLELGIGKGKHAYDKRADARKRDWQREKKRLLNKL